MSKPTITVPLTGATGNQYAQANFNTIYTGLPIGNVNTFYVGGTSDITINRYAGTDSQGMDTITGGHLIANVIVEGNSSDYTAVILRGQAGQITLTNNVTGQAIILALPKPEPGRNTNGFNVEFTDGSLSFTSWTNPQTGEWKAYVSNGVDPSLTGEALIAAWNAGAGPTAAFPTYDSPINLGDYGPYGANPKLNPEFNSGDVTDWTGSGSGATYTLTTNIDTFTGTAYDDTFNAALGGPSVNANTLNSLDSINGNGGTDTLNVELATSVTPTKLNALQNIEIINVSNTTANNLTLGLLQAGQLEVLTNFAGAGTGNLTFNNIAAGTDLVVNSADGSLNDATTFTFASPQTSAYLNVVDVVNGADITVTGVPIVYLESTGGLTNDVEIQGPAVQVLSVLGTTDLDLNALGASITTLNGEAFEGDLLVDVSNQVHSGTATSVYGGLGDDEFVVTNVAIGTGAVASELDGGLGLNAISATYSADQTNVVDADSITIDRIQLVELVARNDSVGGAAVDLGLDASLVGGLEAVAVAGQDASDQNIFTLTGLADSQQVAVVEAVTGVQLELAGDDGVTAVNVVLAIDADSGANIDINEAGAGTAITTVNLFSDENSYTDVDFEAGAFTTINLYGGAAGETLTVGSNIALNATTVYASTLTSDLDATFGASQVTVTGGTGNDIFRLGTSLTGTDSINGGAGDNTVTFQTVAGLVAGTISNVQTLDIAVDKDSAGAFFSSLNVTGVETLNLTETFSGGGTGTNGATFTNLKSTTNQVNLLDGFAGAISLSNAAGQAGVSTLTIGDTTGGGLTTDDVTYNNGAALTVNTVAPSTPGTQTIGGDFNSNTTGLTLASVVNGNLRVTGIITADSATSVAVNAVASEIAAIAGNSFDGLSNLTVTASGTGANITFESNTSKVIAGTAATLASVAISASGSGSSVDMSAIAGGGVIVQSGVNTNASITTLSLTNGAGADVNALVVVDSGQGTGAGTGLSSVGTINLTNNGLVFGDALTLALSLQNGGSVGGSTIGALNVTANAASSTTIAIESLDDTSPTISGGTFSGSGTVAINTNSSVTNLNLSALTMTGFTGALTVTTSTNAIAVVGTSYGETITGQAANAAVTGGGGSDAITLTNGGTANVVYVAQSDSTGTVYDYVTNFAVSNQAGPDLINLAALGLAGGSYSNIGANATITVNGAVTTFAITNAATFFANGVAVASDNAGAAANTVVFIDANLSGAWEAGSDMAIVLVGVDTTGANALSNADFVWA